MSEELDKRIRKAFCAADGMRRCGCCGEMRPYPTEPGAWEFLEDPVLAEYAASTNGAPPFWQSVKIVAGEEGLSVIPKGKKAPVWWPNNAQWRKKKDRRLSANDDKDLMALDLTELRLELDRRRRAMDHLFETMEIPEEVRAVVDNILDPEGC